MSQPRETAEHESLLSARTARCGLCHAVHLLNGEKRPVARYFPEFLLYLYLVEWIPQQESFLDGIVEHRIEGCLENKFGIAGQFLGVVRRLGVFVRVPDIGKKVQVKALVHFGEQYPWPPYAR